MNRNVSSLSSSFIMTCSIIPLFVLLLIPGVGLFDSSSSTSAFAQKYGDDNNSKEESQMENVYVADIDVTMSPPNEGSESAPVTIIEFGDFQCPKCDQWFQNEKPIIKQDYIDTGRANLYFVDFAFLGDDSMTAANASYCAEEQGKYWEFHSHLYNNQGGINEGWASPSNLKMFASDVGLDVVAFDECLDSGKYDDRVEYNTSVGASHGVDGTPTFFIVDNFDGTVERIDGPQPSNIFAGVIDGMLGEPIASASAATEEEVVSDTENQIEEITEDIETAADERPEVNVDVGDDDDNNTTGGGCLIATAAYGTELAPQVQFLREIRDNTVMSTTTGVAFMSGFNSLYYSFSPTISDIERESPMFKDTVRTFITPMISTLSIMTLAEDGNDAEVLVLGMSVIALNLGMYIAAPAAVGFTVRRYVKLRK